MYYHSGRIWVCHHPVTTSTLGSSIRRCQFTNSLNIFIFFYTDIVLRDIALRLIPITARATQYTVIKLTADFGTWQVAPVTSKYS